MVAAPTPAATARAGEGSRVLTPTDQVPAADVGPRAAADVIEVTGTTGEPMDHFGNGYGDWNLSWSDRPTGGAPGGRPAA